MKAWIPFFLSLLVEWNWWKVLLWEACVPCRLVQRRVAHLSFAGSLFSFIILLASGKMSLWNKFVCMHWSLYSVLMTFWLFPGCCRIFLVTDTTRDILLTAVNWKIYCFTGRCVCYILRTSHYLLYCLSTSVQLHICVCDDHCWNVVFWRNVLHVLAVCVFCSLSECFTEAYYAQLLLKTYCRSVWCFSRYVCAIPHLCFILLLNRNVSCVLFSFSWCSFFHRSSLWVCVLWPFCKSWRSTETHKRLSRQSHMCSI